MKLLNSLILFGLCVLTASCIGAGAVRSVENPDSALVYGNLQLPGGKTVHQLVMHEYGVTYITPFKNPPQAHVYGNGNFFFENVKPGKYYIHRFLGERRMYVVPYMSMEKVQAATFEVEPGGIVYVGSYELLVNDNAKVVGPGSFELKAVDENNGLANLRSIADVTRGTGWDKRIQSHINKNLLSKTE